MAQIQPTSHFDSHGLLINMKGNHHHITSHSSIVFPIEPRHPSQQCTTSTMARSSSLHHHYWEYISSSCI